MATLTLRLSNTQLVDIKKMAAKENSTVTEFILKSCGVTNNICNLTLSNVIKKVKGQPKGSKFSLKSLYSYEKWDSYSKGSKLSVGRIFNKAVNENKYNLASIVKFVHKDSSNMAIYERI